MQFFSSKIQSDNNSYFRVPFLYVFLAALIFYVIYGIFKIGLQFAISLLILQGKSPTKMANVKKLSDNTEGFVTKVYLNNQDIETSKKCPAIISNLQDVTVCNCNLCKM